MERTGLCFAHQTKDELASGPASGIRLVAERIRGFDGVRGVGALLVVLTHMHAFRQLNGAGVPVSVTQAVDGFVALQAFFALSGFLITHMLIREHDAFGRVSFRDFYIRRALKIFPLYYLSLALVAVLHSFGDQVSNWTSISFAGLYLHNFIPRQWYSAILGHTWSLAVEEHFYLVWPLTAGWLAFSRRRLLKVLAAFLAISFVCALTLGSSEWLDRRFFLERWTPIAGANIAFGCALAVLISGREGSTRARQWLAGRYNVMVALVLWGSTLWLSDAPILVTQYVRGMGVALLLVWLYLNQTSTAVRFLELAPLAYLGRISYGIYIYQGLFLSTGPYRAAGQTWPPEQWIGLPLLVVVAPLSYHLFEQPIMRLKKRFSPEYDSPKSPEQGPAADDTPVSPQDSRAIESPRA